MGLVGLMPLGALYPSKSGLMNKHIVKHTKLRIPNKNFLSSGLVGALCPSKSGLMNKHTVKHTVANTTYRETYRGGLHASNIS